MTAVLVQIVKFFFLLSFQQELSQKDYLNNLFRETRIKFTRLIIILHHFYNHLHGLHTFQLIQLL